MSAPDRPIRKNRGQMPERFRDSYESAAKPKTGAAYFKAAEITGETVPMPDPDAPVPVERTRARTRGQGEHPGYKPPLSKRARKRKAQAQRPPKPDSESDSPIVANSDDKMELGEGSVQLRSQASVVKETSSGLKTGNYIPPHPSVETKSRRTYSRVAPEDGSEPVPLTEKDLDELEKQEDALELTLLKQSQWKIQMADLDKRIQDGIDKLMLSQKEDAQKKKPGPQRKSLRRAGTTVDPLTFGDMNAKIAMELARGVLDREKELKDEMED